jgi:hypothetical protein
MEYSNTPAVTDDDAVVCRLYDLSRNGETGSNEFLQLDHIVLDRLQATYGGEIQRLHTLAA